MDGVITAVVGPDPLVVADLEGVEQGRDVHVHELGVLPENVIKCIVLCYIDIMLC